MQNNNTKIEFEKLLASGEEAREHGKYGEALAHLDQAALIAAELQDYEMVVNALGQHLLIYKHLFDLSGKQLYVELLYGDVCAGKKICELHSLRGQPKALMALRAGDYLYMKSEFAKAAEQYKSALEELGKENLETYAEYLAFYGLALAKSGDHSGVKRAGEAVEMLKSHKDMRPFHHMIVYSGALMRFSESLEVFGEHEKAAMMLKQARVFADELADKYGMGMRRKQIVDQASRLGIEL